LTVEIVINPISRLLFWARGQKKFAESVGLLSVGLCIGNEEAITVTLFTQLAFQSDFIHFMAKVYNNIISV